MVNIPLANLAALREAAEAAGPVVARALIDLLKEYVQTCDDLEQITRTADATLAAAERAAAEIDAAHTLILRYRVVGAALVQRLRERQRRDPFRFSSDLNGLRRSEERAIGAFHAVDADAIKISRGQRTAQEVSRA